MTRIKSGKITTEAEINTFLNSENKSAYDYCGDIVNESTENTHLQVIQDLANQNNGTEMPNTRSGLQITEDLGPGVKAAGVHDTIPEAPISEAQFFETTKPSFVNRARPQE